MIPVTNRARKMSTSTSATDQRLIFFDSLRYLFVFGVVCQHAGMAYVSTGWWPVDEGFSNIVDLLVNFADGFLMPGLFYISGYFAIPSIRKRSIPAFVQAKLKRLGFPWLICIVFICPILPLVYHYTRNGMQLSVSYLTTWLEVMQNALRFDIGLMPPKPDLMQNDLFYQRYMWFISLLIVFFILFSLLYHYQKRWFEPIKRFKLMTPSVHSTLKIIVYVGMFTLTGSFILIGTMFLMAPGASDPESWFTLGNIIQFRVSRIFLHITYFTLGIFSYKRRWFEQRRFPGHHKTWIVSFVVFMIFYSVARLMVVSCSDELKPLYGLIFWFFLNFFTISALGLSFSLAMRYLNRSTPIHRRLAANSFNVYLAHYSLVVGFQLLLMPLIGVPLLVKFCLVSIGALGGAHLLCQFLIRPYPRLTVALLTGLFAAMVLTLHPG